MPTIKTLKKTFSALTKNPQMLLTIRTPYQTILQNFNNFKRIITKTTDAILIIQNQMPAALHILPPGHLQIKTNSEIKDFSGDFMHLGGFVSINPDNSCEISLFECVDSKDLEEKKLEKRVEEDVGDVFVYKIKKSTHSSFVKKFK